MTNDLRDQIAEAIWNGKASGPIVPWEVILADPDFAGFRVDTYQRADHALQDVVQPELDRRDAEITRLRLAWQSARRGRAKLRTLLRAAVPGFGEANALARRLRARAERAEAELAMERERGQSWADKVIRIAEVRDAAVREAAREREAHDQTTAELKTAEAERYRWHDTYQQVASATDEFLGELLELLPGADEQGSDAYDQIPRGIKKLTTERDQLRELAGTVLEEVDKLGNEIPLSLKSAWGRLHHTFAALDQSEPQPEKCQRCRGLGQVPDWSNWNHEYGEPRPKPCPDCTPHTPLH